MSKKLVVRLFRSEDQEVVFIDDRKVACEYELSFDDVMAAVAEAVTQEKPDKLIYERYWSDTWLIDDKYFREEPELNVEGIRVNSLEDYLNNSERISEPFGGY